ncbi:hypothetical protein CHS0354_019941 [Potamilus streckersoni]|uniref:Uncharacterized protein n=1 Tax=Potamilus streckersoni TaxID=2493646 RepID=A0AAE0S0I6_9BIVA|nr:hypothetical protein CHS0354_019941 [Potamilus streckersoni]
MMADYYRIHSTDHSVALCRELYSFKQRGWMCDVVIEVEDGEMRAHKIVLSASSPFFRNFLSQVPLSSEMTKVLLKGVYMEQLVKIMEYMYAGTFDVNTTAIETTLQICELLRLKFLVEKLKEISKDCSETILSKGTQKLSTISKALNPNENQLTPTNSYCRKPIIAQIKIPGELENGQLCTSSTAVINTDIATIQPVSVSVTTQPRKSPSLKNVITLQTNMNSTSIQKDINCSATKFIKGVDNNFCNDSGLLTLATTADMSRIGTVTPPAGPSGNYGNQVCFATTASVFQPYSYKKMKSLNPQCRTHNKTATVNVRTFMKSFQNIVSISYTNNHDSIKIEGIKNRSITEDGRQTVPVLDNGRSSIRRISEASTQTPYNTDCMESFHENGSQQTIQNSFSNEKHVVKNISDTHAENARKSLDYKISETQKCDNFKNVAGPLADPKIKEVKVKQEGHGLEDPNDDNAFEVLSSDADSFEENYAMSDQSPMAGFASSSKKRKTGSPRKLSVDEHKNVRGIGSFMKDSSMRKDILSGNCRLDRRQEIMARRKIMELKKNLNTSEKRIKTEPVISLRRSLRLTIKQCEFSKNGSDAGLHKNQCCLQYPVKVEHGSNENAERGSSSPSSNVSSAFSSVDSGISFSRSHMEFSPEAKKVHSIDKEQYFVDSVIEIAAKDNLGDKKVNFNETDAGVPPKSYIILKKKSEKRTKSSSKLAENNQKKIKSEELPSKLHSEVSSRLVNEEIKRKEDSDIFAKEDNGNSFQGYKCCVCSSVFRVKVYRASHEHTKHGLPYDPTECEIFRCDFEKCEYETVDKHRFIKHKQFSHSDERPHICEDCGKQFKSLTNLRSHQQTHSHVENASTQHTCPHCEHKFKREQYLKEHIKNVHNKERKELCHLCSRAFAKRLDYHKHMFKVHMVPMPDKYKIYHCDECDFTAFSSYHVTVHKASHKESRDHQCPKCSKTFKSVNAVKRHLTYHDTPSFVCEHENCNYAAFSKSTLLSHIKLKHTQKGMKPFECQFCSYKCVIKGNMVKHIRLVHDLDVVTKYTLKDKEKYKDMQPGTLITKSGKCFDPIVDEVPRKKLECCKPFISVGSNSQLSHGNKRPILSQMESQTVLRRVMKAASNFEQLNMEQLENIGFQVPTDATANIQEPFPSGSQNSTGLHLITSQDLQYHNENQSTIQAEAFLDENAIAAEDLIVSQEETIQTTSNSPQKRVIVIKSNPRDSFLETADLIQAAIGQGDETSRSLGILTALLAAGQQTVD